MNVILRHSGVVLLLLLMMGCAGSSPTGPSNPEWVNALIARFQKEPVTSPPRAIYQYTYRGQTVYYVPPAGGDQYSTLYDATGEVLCAPDGGLTGRGDGRCSDFMQARTNEVLIWRDTRTR